MFILPGENKPLLWESKESSTLGSLFELPSKASSFSKVNISLSRSSLDILSSCHSCHNLDALLIAIQIVLVHNPMKATKVGYH